MTPTAEDVADADRQFWVLSSAIRGMEREDATNPELADLYEDAEYLARTGITPRIRDACGAMVEAWHRRDGGGALRVTGRTDGGEPK